MHGSDGAQAGFGMEVMRVDEQGVLSGPFDPDLHMRTFHNYFETVMTDNGTVVYANPSHTRVLERLYTAKHKSEPTYDDYRSYVMACGVLSYDEWLMEATGAICLWTHGYSGRPNERQLDEIGRLVEKGLMVV